jgi:hypothetical protein
MELSNRVYYYKENSENISILQVYKTDEKYIIEYKQSYNKSYNKIMSLYDFEIIKDTEQFDNDSGLNTKILIMEVHTDKNPKPENLYVLYESDINIKTIYLHKYDYLFENLNGSFKDNFLIFEQKYNNNKIDDDIINKIFTYNKENDLWVTCRDDGTFAIKVSEDNIFDTLLRFKYLKSETKLSEKKLSNNEINFEKYLYDLRFEKYENHIMLSHNDYSYSDTIFSILEGIRMKRIGKTDIYCGFDSSDKTYHYFQLINVKKTKTIEKTETNNEDDKFLSFRYLESKTQLNNKIKFPKILYELKFEINQTYIMLGKNDYSDENKSLFQHLEPVKMERIGKSNIYYGFHSQYKTYHYFRIELLTFEEECSICDVICDKFCGWKCFRCDKCYCDQHNTEEFVCKC